MINTPPQIMLYEAFGAKAPRVRAPADDARAERREALEAPRRRQRHASTATRATRRTPSSTTSRASAGRTAIRRSSRRTSSSQAFSWEACGRGDGKFDAKKFLAINHEHLKTERLMPTDEYATRTLPVPREARPRRASTTRGREACALHDSRARHDVRRGRRHARLRSSASRPSWTRRPRRSSS